MTTTKSTIFTEGRAKRPMRMTGYAISIGINLVLIWVVANLVEWDILPFLTEDFEELVPITIFSLIAGTLINAAWLVFDPPWFRTLGDTLNSGIAFFVVLRTFQVFPFEFESSLWTGLTRGILVCIAIATALATLVNIAKLVTGKTH